MTKVSIAIPTWENNGRGAEFLDDLIRTIVIQTLTDYEIIVSDHSEDNAVKNVVKSYESQGINIKHVRNNEKRGNSPANTNAAIELCTGEVVKIMFQDDFFYDDEALEKIYNALSESDKDWLVCGCNHTQTDGRDFYRTFMPKWNPDLIKGVNTISSPSVMAFKNDKVKDRFDENVVMMMDCEMYYRMEKVHGQPIFLHDDLVTNRVHEGQISMQTYNSVDYADRMEKEIRYCAKKHSIKIMENLLMNNFFLTTFNKRLYDEYAKDLIKTYLDTKQTIPLVCYVEEDDFSIYPQHDNIKYFNLFDEVPEIRDFIKRNKHKPVKTYMYDGVRFCYKVYAQYAGRNLGRRQFFVDADCVFRKQIPEKWYDDFIGECDFSYYPRPSMYSETGFVVFNCESKLVQKFFDRYIESYNTDEIYSMKTQNDSVVFDNILKEFPQRTETLHGAGDNLEVYKYGRHVMARCPILSPYVDHRKGNRKKQKNSPELMR